MGRAAGRPADEARASGNREMPQGPVQDTAAHQSAATALVPIAR